MKRLLILIFVLNTLLPSMGFTTMLPFNADEKIAMSNKHYVMSASTSENTHCISDQSHIITTDDQCNTHSMSDGLCKIKCAVACTSLMIHVSEFSFVVALSVHAIRKQNIFQSFESHTLSPELPPPLIG